MEITECAFADDLVTFAEMRTTYSSLQRVDMEMCTSGNKSNDKYR